MSEIKKKKMHSIKKANFVLIHSCVVVLAIPELCPLLCSLQCSFLIKGSINSCKNYPVINVSYTTVISFSFVTTTFLDETNAVRTVKPAKLVMKRTTFYPNSPTKNERCAGRKVVNHIEREKRRISSDFVYIILPQMRMNIYNW